MSRPTNSPVEAAASLLLTQIASQDGQLFRVLSALGMLQETSSKRQVRFDAPEPLEPDVVSNLAKDLGVALPPGLLDVVETRTGLPGSRVLEAAVKQLRLVASFAISDGGAVPENVRAVERFVRSGGVEMFAAA